MLTDLIWRWIDRRGRIPFWAFWFWPKAHWCCELDDLLILDNTESCFCEVCNPDEIPF